ncbi:NAD-dependent epimerase/dehydratase family protein [Pseudomonas cavernae]|uniref:NAD-dependent epimerase/dehydratase family protein n=1 Tax=Pseudomonas cavernae TaxID=2320867 RepID=UPI001EE58211|nr:NAD-dependent epimerase/dehydratase family protein [Pseudomonas cavernae]
MLNDGRYSPVAALRRQSVDLPGGVHCVQVGDLSANTSWSEALVGVKVVIHAAARAHVLNETADDPLVAFRRVNVSGTLALARQAAQAGVERFIFISSIGVNGNQSSRPFTADDLPSPNEPYAVSKHEAELGLRQLAAETSMEIVIIRPPLVYGPKAPGNFGRLIKTVSKGVPLPLGAIHNRRSLVALDNLVDLIVTCIDHPAAANQTFLVSDGEDLSTTELLRRMGVALGKPARLLPVPSWLLEAGAAMLGKRALSRRLCSSLQVDISKTRELLGWAPPVSVDAALRKTATHFLEHHT